MIPLHPFVAAISAKLSPNSAQRSRRAAVHDEHSPPPRLFERRSDERIIFVARHGRHLTVKPSSTAEILEIIRRRHAHRRAPSSRRPRFLDGARRTRPPCRTSTRSRAVTASRASRASSSNASNAPSTRRARALAARPRAQTRARVDARAPSRAPFRARGRRANARALEREGARRSTLDARRSTLDARRARSTVDARGAKFGASPNHGASRRRARRRRRVDDGSTRARR